MDGGFDGGLGGVDGLGEVNGLGEGDGLGDIDGLSEGGELVGVGLALVERIRDASKDSPSEILQPLKAMHAITDTKMSLSR